MNKKKRKKERKKERRKSNSPRESIERIEYRESGESELTAVWIFT